MTWVLDCIFDDLLDFNDWEIRARTADGPVDGFPNTAGGLIALGGGNMQCARCTSYLVSVFATHVSWSGYRPQDLTD